MTDARMYQSWIGRKVVGHDGAKIGRIDEIYHDGQTGRPAWITVQSGLLGTRTSFIPVEGAQTVGGDVQIPYSKQEVKGAPNIQSRRRLSPTEEQRLLQHYSMLWSDPGYGFGGRGELGRQGDRGTIPPEADG